MKELLFGTAGIPICTEPRNTENGIMQAKKLGLGAMELEFVHSVNISEEKAVDVKKIAQNAGITLTCHGQYYINLNAKEEKKQEASRKRIINAATRLHQCGGWSCVFHPGFYLGMGNKQAYDNIRRNLKETVKELDNLGVKVWIRPETTGKQTQFGHFRELLELSSEIEGVMPCIDFAHVHARENGLWNSAEEFRKILKETEKALGKEGIRNMHIHCTGIAYGEKGEKHHLNLKHSDMNYKDLCAVWKEYKIAGAVICESPNIEEDALLLKKTYERA